MEEAGYKRFDSWSWLKYWQYTLHRIPWDFCQRPIRKVKNETSRFLFNYFLPIITHSWQAWDICCLAFAEPSLSPNSLFHTLQGHGPLIEFDNLFPVNKTQGSSLRPAGSSHLQRKRRPGKLAYLFLGPFYKGCYRQGRFLQQAGLVSMLFLIKGVWLLKPLVQSSL